MTSNLPPGCRPEDHAVDRAISDKKCVACQFYDVNSFYEKPCSVCFGNADACFKAVEDLAVVAERLKASAEAREDGHCDD